MNNNTTICQKDNNNGYNCDTNFERYYCHQDFPGVPNSKNFDCQSIDDKDSYLCLSGKSNPPINCQKVSNQFSEDLRPFQMDGIVDFEEENKKQSLADFSLSNYFSTNNQITRAIDLFQGQGIYDFQKGLVQSTVSFGPQFRQYISIRQLDSSCGYGALSNANAVNSLLSSEQLPSPEDVKKVALKTFLGKIVNHPNFVCNIISRDQPLQLAESEHLFKVAESLKLTNLMIVSVSGNQPYIYLSSDPMPVNISDRQDLDIRVLPIIQVALNQTGGSINFILHTGSHYVLLSAIKLRNQIEYLYLDTNNSPIRQGDTRKIMMIEGIISLFNQSKIF